MLDSVVWNRNNTTPTADRPLLIVFKGLIPSLKNKRDVGMSKDGKVFSRPNAEVTKAIASIRDSLDRQLPPTWVPIASPQQISALMILGAHGVTSIPDADTDNLAQTVIEALAAPRVKEKMTDDRRKRLIIQDDKQVVSLHPFRRAFVNKDRIYHELYIWLSAADGNPLTDIEEYGRVVRLREESLRERN